MARSCIVGRQGKAADVKMEVFGIAESQCALLKEFVPKGKCILHEDACKKCGQCLVPGCPAMVKQENGIPKIDAAMCNGCELCAKRCKFHAIELIPREKGGKA